MKLLIEKSRLTFLVLISFQSSLAAAVPVIDSANTSLPIVDLGVSVNRATLNASGDHPYLNFSNIRYAQPPVGNLRFAAPVAPTVRNATINDGQNGVICPQANPAWEVYAEEWLAGANLSTLKIPQVTISNIPAQDPRTSEDCLFLDVIVPQSVFNQNSSAPVLIWLYGGGYIAGNKLDSGSPAGLLERSFDDHQNGVVFVALNYRLGLFGWLSGSDDITANAGLLDQLLAFQWIQDNIHRFGGDPKRVTVMGESAGAGSIMHHITAHGDTRKTKAPFRRAILQSPAFQPTLPVQEKGIFGLVLETASQITNTSINAAADLRNLSYQTLQDVNSIVVGNSQYGTFTFGPVVDGSYVPTLPGISLQNGTFDSSVEVMVGHNSDEGLLFTPPFIQNQSSFVQSIEELFPTASPAEITYITQTLYPPDFSGAYGYTSQIERTALITSDTTITCNTQFLNLAFQNKTYAYIFSVPPGLHGEDIAYTFFNGDTTTSDEGNPVNATLANTFQDYLVNFAISGDPKRRKVPDFPVYGMDSTVRILEYSNLTAYAAVPPSARCEYWQSAPYA